jgi:hypothetical protein
MKRLILPLRTARTRVLAVGLQKQQPGRTIAASKNTFTAVLLPANEVPAVVGAEATGSGTATITLNLTKDSNGYVTAATVDFSVTVTGFPNGTSLTGAHIHGGAAGTNGGILVSTGLAPATSPSRQAPDRSAGRESPPPSIRRTQSSPTREASTSTFTPPRTRAEWRAAS